jgi:arsenate reductase
MAAAIRIYAYKNCGTCRKALKWLDAHDIDYELIAIREKPPTKTELKGMLRHVNGELRRLFNTSGGDYKTLGLKDRISAMKQGEAIALLNGNGNLVKRPFVIGKNCGLVGFKEDEWRETLL